MRKVSILLVFLSLFSISYGQNTDTRLYELRIYYTENGRMDALVQRFANHTLNLFKKHGITNVGYWIATADPNKMLYILSYPNREARDASWKAFGNDPDWKKAREDSEKDGKIVAKVESIFMNTTDFSPTVKKKDIKKVERTFELRTYYMLPNRLPNILARFKNHTMKLFENHGMTNIAYWVTVEKDGSQAKLVYILAHKSEEAGKASFGTFVNDPEWIKVRDDSEKDGKIVEKIESVYMKPTAFSKIK
jgi:hypothetical protein